MGWQDYDHTYLTDRADALAPARGAVLGVILGAACWCLLGAGLFAAGWLLAGVRLP